MGQQVSFSDDDADRFRGVGAVMNQGIRAGRPFRGGFRELFHLGKLQGFQRGVLQATDQWCIFKAFGIIERGVLGKIRETERHHEGYQQEDPELMHFDLQVTVHRGFLGGHVIQEKRHHHYLNATCAAGRSMLHRIVPVRP